MCQSAANGIAGHVKDLHIRITFTFMCQQTIAMAPKWCHSDAMDLTPYVDNLRHELAVAAEAGGEDAKTLAERLTAPLESAVRLTLLDALSTAAAEITRDLAPGSVDLRLRGREPEFVVTPALREPTPIDADEQPTPVPRAITESDDAAMTRINLRLGQELKDRIEAAAREAGISVNAWLVRSAAAALEGGTSRNAPRQRASQGADTFTGWVH